MEESVFCTRLKELREDACLSQDELANAIGETRAIVRNWELGKSDIKHPALIKLSKYFGVSADWLLGLSDVKTLNKTVAAAADFTGLSEEAVKVLHIFRPDADWPHPRNVAFMSEFIIEFAPVFCASLGNLFDALEEADNRLASIHELSTDEMYSELDRLEEKIQVALFRFNRLCEQIPDGIGFESNQTLEKIYKSRSLGLNKAEVSDNAE